MAMYWTCRYGANHDCGERCDCEAEENKREKESKSMIVFGDDGQAIFSFIAERREKSA